jgi:hypothetical protein
MFNSAPLMIGTKYFFRVRAKNSVGFSEWSEMLTVSLTFKPSKPNKPMLISLDNTKINLQFSSDNVNTYGSPILRYKLYYAVNDSNSLIEAANYLGNLLNHELKKTENNLLDGKIYKICLTAVNINGESECSEFLFVGFTSSPSKVNEISKMEQYSTNESVTIKWKLLENKNPPAGNIIGYGIYISDIESTDITLNYSNFFDTSLSQSYISNSNFYTFNNLIPNTKYYVQIRGKDLNGFGEKSDVFNFHTCMRPDKVKNLKIQEMLKDSITLTWDLPQNIGGCPLKGLMIMRDDGNNGDINIEVNSANESTLINNPFARFFKITNLPADSLGKSIRFTVTLFNTSEKSVSEELAILHSISISSS